MKERDQCLENYLMEPDLPLSALLNESGIVPDLRQSLVQTWYQLLATTKLSTLNANQAKRGFSFFIDHAVLCIQPPVIQSRSPKAK